MSRQASGTARQSLEGYPCTPFRDQHSATVSPVIDNHYRLPAVPPVSPEDMRLSSFLRDTAHVPIRIEEGQIPQHVSSLLIIVHGQAYSTYSNHSHKSQHDISPSFAQTHLFSLDRIRDQRLRNNGDSFNAEHRNSLQSEPIFATSSTANRKPTSKATSLPLLLRLLSTLRTWTIPVATLMVCKSCALAKYLVSPAR